MDISTLRLGLAHSALRQALGDELSPISFAQGSFAFVHRQTGAQFFCCAESAALPIMAILPNGKLGDGSDESSQAMRALAEPLYLDAWSTFARDFDRASSTEARARAHADAETLSNANATATAPTPSPAPARTHAKTRPAALAPLRALPEPAAPTLHEPAPAELLARPVAPASRAPAPMAPSLPPIQPRSITEHTVIRRAMRVPPANPMADRV